MAFAASAAAKLGVRATFECKNAAGEVIKTIEVSGAVPLADLDMSEDEARALITHHEDQSNGTDNRQ